MGNPVSRIPDSTASVVSKASDKNLASRPEISPDDAFPKLVGEGIENYHLVDSNTANLKLGSPLDRLARQLVFESIVRRTLENSNHPYYSLVGTETRNAMIKKLTEVLNSSHYLTPPSKRQTTRQG